jgi:5-methyltetrahydrofolate--homocysteine methyltransferase
MNLLELIKSKKILVSDGAWGTSLFKRGLQVGECPEEWNISRSDIVKEIAESYIDAGSDIICTNSFGGNRLKLMQYGLHYKTTKINETAASISRLAAKDKIVFGSIGPTGKFLITGDVSEQEMYEAYHEQAAALKSGGADLILFETFYDFEEARIAIRSVKDNLNIPVACTFTFDKQPDNTYKSIMGISPAIFAAEISEMDVDIIGSNCGLGFQNMVEIARVLRNTKKDIPLLVQANAGLPQSINGEIVYSETPEFISPYIEDLINTGVNIIGGCCGTTPEHIRTIRTIVDNREY